eukprot:jgi/Pico_ML_1/50973/g2087.t2
MARARTAWRIARTPHQRWMGTIYDDREKGEERLYFAKEDERLLRKLAAKIKASSPDAGSTAAEIAELDKIVSKYSMSTEDKKKLIEWRHSHDF